MRSGLPGQRARQNCPAFSMHPGRNGDPMITTGMNVIRKLIYTAVMAVSALNLAPSMAAAQEPARGRFTLTHDVFWETAKVPAGDYSFSFGSNGISPVLILQK